MLISLVKRTKSKTKQQSHSEMTISWKNSRMNELAPPSNYAGTFVCQYDAVLHHNSIEFAETLSAEK